MTGKAFEIVVGKGGVGKSTVAAALATRYAAAGHRTLAVELAAPAGLAQALGVPGVAGAEPRSIGPGLSYAWIDGESALAEYLALILPVRRVLATVLDSRVYRYFVAAAPGLKELMTVGKLWYEHEREIDGAKVWDRIVIDAGASGHSLQYLCMPAAAVKTFSSGLVHRESQRILELLRDRDKTAVHVVSTPESMPMVEAAEIVAQLRGDLDLPVGRVYVNRCRKAPPDGAADALECLADAGDERISGVVSAGGRELGWYGIQERAIADFVRGSGIEPDRLPLLAVEEFGRREVVRLSSLVTAYEGERA